MSALPGTRGRRRIYLMRHGEVSYHQPGGQVVFGDVDLTEEGVTQARQMAELLADVHFDAAVCTSLRRTRRTAELVLAGRDVPVREVAALQELKGGSIAGLSEARIEAEFVYGMERAAEPGAGFPGGETFAEFQGRIVPAFERLILEPGWTTMLLVAHGGTNAMILSWFTRGGLAGPSAFEQDAGCVNVLDVDVIDGEIVRRLIRAINLTPYNYAKRDHFLTVAERIVSGRQGS
jgi:probable phosphoglycerate mutase